MFNVAGSNLFGQWFLNNPIFTHFQIVDVKSNLKSDLEIKLPELVHISWSYNIFKINNKYFVSGFWGGEENRTINLNIPENCISNKSSKVVLTGNENCLFLASAYSQKLWHVSLENDNLIKEINCAVETPLKNTERKKRKRCDDVIVKMAATNNSLLCLTDSGTVYDGFLPSYLATDHCLGNVCDIQCGNEHYILLTDTGRVYTWGNGRRLQLGHGNLNNLDMPTEVEALGGIKIVKVSAGGWHNLALSEHGDVYVWGWNDTGQLGLKELTEDDEDTKTYGLPTLLDLFDDNKQEVKLNVKDISCGSRHSAILLENNTVWTSGYNKYGQLGFLPEDFPSVNQFKKSFYFQGNFTIKCGPWCTVLEIK